MNDDRGHTRRFSDGEPVTAGEVARWVERHERSSDRTHRDLAALISKLDERTDALVVRVAVVFAVATALWGILVLIAPFLRDLIGLPSG